MIAMKPITIISEPWNINFKQYPDINKSIAVVIDVLRATSTIVSCLSAKASIVIPAQTIEESFMLRDAIGKAVLVGEKNSLIIPGFDLGNSPKNCFYYDFSYTPAIIKSTNGTPLIRSLSNAAQLLAASFLNLSTVADFLRILSRSYPILIVEAGDEQKFSPPDNLCATLLKNKIIDPNTSVPSHSRLSDFMISSPHGRDLVKKGLAEDIYFSAQIDKIPIIPYFNGFGFVSIG